MLINEKDLKVHFDGDEELIGELLEVFEETYPETLLAIKSSIETENFQDLELHAHTLKGMIANFFAEDLKQKAFILEQQGRNKEKTELIENFNELNQKLPLLVNELKAIL
ncbi:MAG: Hpt domain-containing protein [Bacteriovoracaceae bacterium]|jgi:HPt (histidine-containing phosphotransfer) domain-containing protein|nr:Hpt domain-containing protein [Bacteriovoracaceae bacterium]